MSESKLLTDTLVSTSWLADHLNDPMLRIVDIRGYVKTVDAGNGKQVATYVGAPDEYEEGHIPGSVYIDWTRDIVDLDDPVPAQIAPAREFAEAMAYRGIGNETAVVAVDHSGGHFATRLWWALKYHGHEQAAILDGGYAKWIGENRPMSTEAPQFERRVFVPKVRPELRADVDIVRSAIGSARHQLIDARDAETFTGQVYRGSRSGHITGAINVPAKGFYREDGTWLDRDGLQERLTAGGFERGKTAIAYCNGGVTATAVLFALDRIGYSDFSNYDGSWNEWGERPELPVETGDSSRTD